MHFKGMLGLCILHVKVMLGLCILPIITVGWQRNRLQVKCSRTFLGIRETMARAFADEALWILLRFKSDQSLLVILRCNM